MATDTVTDVSTNGLHHMATDTVIRVSIDTTATDAD